MPPMMAVAQPTPARTVMAPEAQFFAQAPHSMQAPRSRMEERPPSMANTA
jgi:hypothetical protein